MDDFQRYGEQLGEEIRASTGGRERVLRLAGDFLDQMVRQTVAHDEARQQIVSSISPDMIGTGKLMEITGALRMLAGADRSLGEAVARIIEAVEGRDPRTVYKEGGPEMDLSVLKREQLQAAPRKQDNGGW